MDRFEVIIKQMEAEILGYKKDFEIASAKCSKLRGILTYIAEKICDSSYGNNQLGGKNAMLTLSDEELRDFLIDNVLKQKINFTENICDLQRVYLSEQREKEVLANRILELEEKVEQLSLTTPLTSMGVPSTSTNTHQFNQDTGEIIENNENNTNTTDKPINIHIGTNGSVFDIEKEYSKLSMYHFALIQAIGEFGFSEAGEIIKKTTELVNIKDTLVRSNLDELVKSEIITQTKNPTPLRKNLFVYCLSDFGKKIYFKHFNKNSVKSEMQLIAEQHDNIVHGYGIKDLAEALKQNGRTKVCYDSKKNQFPVPGMPGQRYVPDITSTLDGKTTEYWEYELAHHMQDDFNQKLLKASVLTNVLNIIAPDKPAKDKIATQLEEFMTYLMISDKKVKLKVYYGTMRELMDGILFSNSNCLIEIN